MNEICHELHFNNRVVKTFKKRDTNFWKAFQKNKSKYPQNIAVTDGNKKFTYEEIYNFVLSQSAYIKNLGINKGDRICLLFENSWPLIVYTLVGLKNGVIIVPLNPKSSEVENQMIINDCTPKAVFLDQNFCKNLPSKDNISTVADIIVFQENTILKNKTIPAIDEIKVNEENTAFILYTSGTTGKPKGAMLTNFNIIHSCLHFKRHFNLSEKDNCILVVPSKSCYRFGSPHHDNLVFWWKSNPNESL